MKKPLVLISYDYFYPGYKAGGPVQSITNLVAALQHIYTFAVLTTAYDLKSAKPYDNVKQNCWSLVNIPHIEEPVQVWYAGRGMPSFSALKKLIKKIKPDFIYLNGIYSYRLFLLPLLYCRLTSHTKAVVCPRGMLQSSALAVKGGKKKYYIRALQLSGVVRKIYWHATSPQEGADIIKYFPVSKGVMIASNIPKTPFTRLTFPQKKAGELRLVQLALISEMKNVLLLLQVIKLLPPAVQLHIYGPVKEAGYWQQCLPVISSMGAQVIYMGDIEPAAVQDMLASYHAMVLLTRGENFGHAIYESLSVGRPVITSHFTPWHNLRATAAGDNADIDNINDCVEKISSLASLSQKEYNICCQGAHKRALSYFNSLQATMEYRKLFS